MLERIMKELINQIEKMYHYNVTIHNTDKRYTEIKKLTKNYQRITETTWSRNGYRKHYEDTYRELINVKINDKEFVIYYYDKPEKNYDPIITGKYRLRTKNKELTKCILPLMKYTLMAIKEGIILEDTRKDQNDKRRKY